jgi:acetoin utilization deacetylase AcuC-like enzyme
LRIFSSSKSDLHDPKTYFRKGALIAHPDRVERLHVLEAALRQAGYDLSEPVDLGDGVIEAVHDADYLTLLRTAWTRRGEIDPAADLLMANQFARPQMHRRPGGLLGQLGYHTADTSTPIQAGTWDAIRSSAQAAANAADAAFESGQAYALCRPPGHHAYADCAGGFCYLNNTAIAAQRLRERTGGPVAVLDLDVHHGNGTQGIFYQRADVLTVSIHGDPSSLSPFFSGYAEEVGAGAGTGFNLNLPLAHGSGDDLFLAAVAKGLERITAFEPSALVIALGLDASEHDPLGALKVTTAGFERVAATLAAKGWPTAIIQEGGYLCAALPTNLIRFLGSFAGARDAR